ncbi:MAG: methyl-accepting chemotaxis protein, partial [Syntrophorhabdus sp.]
MKRYFVNLKLSRKILFSPVLVLSMLIIFGAVAYIGLMSQKSTVDKIFNNAFTNYKKASTIKDQVTTVHQNIYKVLAWSGSSEQRDRAQDLGRAQLAILGNVIKNIETNLENKALSVNDKKIYAILLNNLQEYNRPIESVVDAVTANGAAAAAFMNEGEAKYQTLNEDLARMMDQEDTAASMQYASSITGFRRILGLCAIVLLLAVISSVLATIFTARVILDPIKKTVSMIETIARGDLTQRIDIDSRDEIGSMAREFNNFIDILRDIISRVADNSHRVSDAATMLDTAAEQMATGVEQAACQVNSVAAASEEMSMTSSEIAENCVRVARSSEEANGSVRTGET